ncbi:hypothetical protein [Paenibacillus tianmuensis]|nr:hypothetical protein [Paenibacillus tianmuensis]
MDLQLELLPYHYYNTLGFDAELIDYIDHVDDSIVFEKIAPLYKNWANVNGYKHKRCACPDQSTCTCEKTYSDPDAACGVQRTKANQNKFFIGYRKHSIVCPSPKGPIVLFSIILPRRYSRCQSDVASH